MTISFRVAYLGPPASFSHQAALQLFPEDSTSTQLVSHPTIPSLFRAIFSGSVDRTVVPIENSTNGPVNPTLDLIAAACNDDSGATLQVCGETSVRVKQCLAGRRADWKLKGQTRLGNVNSATDFSHITSLHTHPQAWTQCTAFLNKNFGPEVLRRDEDSTSAAAELVAADVTGTSAAICSALAAEVFGLDILADGIEGEGHNETRFLVLKNGGTVCADFHNSELACTPGQSIMGLVVLKIHHNTPLTRVHQALEEVGLKKTHIFSRKVEDLWAYLFFGAGRGQEKMIEDFKSKLSGSDCWDWGRWPVKDGKYS